MSVQTKKTTKASTAIQTAGSASMVEALEGRQLFSASPAVADADFAAAAAAGSGGGGAGKVAMQDFHFVMKVNKASPKLF